MNLDESKLVGFHRHVVCMSECLFISDDTDFMFFFFKQKTAYEMLRSLVGSEMCIRDRTTGVS